MNFSGKQSILTTDTTSTLSYNSGKQNDSSTDISLFTGVKNTLCANTKNTPDNINRKQPHLFTNTKNTSCNNKGFSLLEVLLVSGIMLIIITGLASLLPDTMKINNLIHSQLSESDFRKFVAKSLNGDGCTNTFNGNIGDSVSIIKDTDDNTIWQMDTNRDGDLTDLKDGLFNRNFKVIKITTAPTEPTATPGYANMQVFFTRPGGTFPKKDNNLDCSTTDQSGCYKQVCLLKLSPTQAGDPPPPGTAGTQMQKCALLSCAGRGGEEGAPQCYQVEDDRTLVGCGTTTNITRIQTTAYGFNAGQSGTGEHNTFIGYSAGKATTGNANIFMGYSAGRRNTTGYHNSFMGYSAGRRNTTGYHNSFMGYSAGGSSTTGYHNSFMGYSAGGSNTTGFQNTFLGYSAGYNNTTGNYNTFLGYKAGYNNTTDSNRLNIGNVIYGTTSTTDNNNRYPTAPGVTVYGVLRVCESGESDDDCFQVMPPGSGSGSGPSYRTLKKNIKLFKKTELTLQDVLNTSPFTFEYKEYIKGELTSFRKEIWLKFKALNDFTTHTFSQLKKLIKEFAEFKTDTQTKFTNTQTKLTDTQTKIQQNNKYFRKNTAELNNLKEENTELKKEIKAVQKKLMRTNKELADVKKESADTKQNLQDQITKELKETKTQFSKTITELKRELTNIKQNLPKPSPQK